MYSQAASLMEARFKGLDLTREGRGLLCELCWENHTHHRGVEQVGA